MKSPLLPSPPKKNEYITRTNIKPVIYKYTRTHYWQYTLDNNNNNNNNNNKRLLCISCGKANYCSLRPKGRTKTSTTSKQKQRLKILKKVMKNKKEKEKKKCSICYFNNNL